VGIPQNLTPLIADPIDWTELVWLRVTVQEPNFGLRPHFLLSDLAPTKSTGSITGCVYRKMNHAKKVKICLRVMFGLLTPAG